MDSVEESNLLSYFSRLEDRRCNDGRKKHELLNIVVITILGVICGADDWVAISNFGKSKESFLSSFLHLPHGIPSHDTFQRVFSLLDPVHFSEVFVAWVQALQESINEEIVAIDGKTLRGSFDRSSGIPGLHLVHAWACKNRLVLGQVAVDEKSNEITAIPELLKQLCISQCTVTLDAMGCQKKIAAQIREQEANYVLALKGNHGDLHQQVAQYFKDHTDEDFINFTGRFHQTIDADHGRIETRKYYLDNNIKWTGAQESWKDLAAFGMVIATREQQGKITNEARIFLTSIEHDITKFAHAVRAHWNIENNLHWSLDVSFQEDKSRVREKNTAQNLAIIRKMALVLLKKDKKTKAGIKTKRLKAGWDDKYLIKIIKNA